MKLSVMNLLGVHVMDLVKQQLKGQPLNLRALITQPLIFPEGLSLLKR